MSTSRSEALTALTTGTTTSNTGPASEVAEVDCSTLSIPLQPVPRTDFTLTWTAATGATSYTVAVFDSGGNEITTLPNITGTSVGMNGGTQFPDNGEVHVRAFLDGQYACFVSFAFGSRAPDPNEPAGGYNFVADEAGASLEATLVFCEFFDGFTFEVEYSNASDTVTVDVGDGMAYQGSAPSGTIADYSATASPSVVTVSDDDDTINLSTADCIVPA